MLMGGLVLSTGMALAQTTVTGKVVSQEDGELYISKVFVDEGVTMKRMRPAPQGRGYRIRKRSNHVTLFVDAKTNDEK